MPYPKPRAQALLSLGGIERASVMLAICRFDADQNGNLTDREYRVFQEGGKELLRNTVTTCAQPYPAGHRVWVRVRVIGLA